MKKVLLVALVALAVCSCAKTNPLLGEWTDPYGIAPYDKIELKHYLPAIEAAIAEQNAEIEAIVNNAEEATYENTIVARNNTGKKLANIQQAWSLRTANYMNDANKEVNDKIQELTRAHNEELNNNEAYKERVTYVYEHRNDEGLYDENTVRAIERAYNALNAQPGQGGQGGQYGGGQQNQNSKMTPEQQEEYNRLGTLLSAAQRKFSSNVTAETANWTMLIDKEEDLAGLSEVFIEDAAERAKKAGSPGKWLIGLDNPSAIPFLTFADNRDLRIKVMDAYLNRGNNDNEYNNVDTLVNIAKYKLERAKLQGYKSYADQRLTTRMAGNAKTVYDLLDKTWAPTVATSAKEAALIAERAAKDGITEVLPADYRYYMEKVRSEMYDVTAEDFAPYFPFESVREGLFYVANKLFGLQFRVIPYATPNDQTSGVECLDADGTPLGIVFFDVFARPGLKGNGASCGTVRRGDASTGQVQFIRINANFPQPVGKIPCLMTYDDVETLFHEFGHALASLMGKGGLGDFSELPSQLNEHWAEVPEVIKYMAKHYVTGEAIPDELVQKYLDYNSFGAGFASSERVAAMYMDIDLYSQTSFPADFDLLKFEADDLSSRGLISQIPPRYRFPYFNHIVGGYDVGYYTYLWAEVFDCDAFEAFVETGDVFNKEVADRYRHEFLEKAGELRGMDLYVNFRGHEPSIEPMLKYKGIK
ncbi:MAG: M3 family metallopeptidase [Bacteroidales bacterium]|nr:M3 family metallopeptidase [Bacteroidales bacterium]